MFINIDLEGHLLTSAEVAILSMTSLRHNMLHKERSIFLCDRSFTAYRIRKHYYEKTKILKTDSQSYRNRKRNGHCSFRFFYLNIWKIRFPLNLSIPFLIIWSQDRG